MGLERVGKFVKIMRADIESVPGSSKSTPPAPRLGRKSWVRRVFGNRAVIMLVIDIGFILIMTRLSPYFLYAGNGFANFRVMFVSMAMDTIVLGDGHVACRRHVRSVRRWRG